VIMSLRDKLSSCCSIVGRCWRRVAHWVNTKLSNDGVEGGEIRGRARLAAMYLDEACVFSHLSPVENNNTDLANGHIKSFRFFPLISVRKDFVWFPAPTAFLQRQFPHVRRLTYRLVFSAPIPVHTPGLYDI
jgi:hypothetical protein